MMILAFSVLLKFLPSARMQWRDAALGASGWAFRSRELLSAAAL